MTREAFSTIIAKVVPDVMEEKIDEMWKLHSHRLSEGMSKTITRSHFAS